MGAMSENIFPDQSSSSGHRSKPVHTEDRRGHSSLNLSAGLVNKYTHFASFFSIKCLSFQSSQIQNQVS